MLTPISDTVNTACVVPLSPSVTERATAAAEDADLILLDLGLDLELLPLDQFHQLSRLFEGDALLQLDLLPDPSARRRLHLSPAEGLERHLPLHQLPLQQYQKEYQRLF